MEAGGNRKLKEFFAFYNLNDVYDIKVKYSTLAADYYRRRNYKLSEGKTISEEAPSFEHGRTLLDGRRLNADGEP